MAGGCVSAPTYDPDKADRVLDELKAGETLAGICRNEWAPKRTTFLDWVDKDIDGLGDRYARARRLGTEKMAEDILEIADDGSNDTYEDEDGNKRVDHDVIQRSKLRVDTRRWLLSKIIPHVYGDKPDKPEGNDDEPAPISVNISVVDARKPASE